jgi:hypothetical protein
MERQFLTVAASFLGCRLAGLDGGALPDGCFYDPVSVLLGELACRVELELILQEYRMLPAQRLARCAAGLGVSDCCANASCTCR